MSSSLKDMNLIFVIEQFGVGGKERRCLQLIKGLNDLGVKNIHLVLIDDIIGYREVYDLDVKIHVVGRKSKKDLSVFFRLFKIVKEIKPDIVLSWSLMSSLWLNFIHLFLRFNYLCAYVASTLPPSKYSIKNIIKLISFNRAKYIIGNSKLGLEVFEVPNSKSYLIYNGFDFRRIENLSPIYIVKNSLDVKTRYLITMVARVSEGKDYKTYIEGARLVIEERDDVTFLAVGDGPLLDYFRKQLSETEKKYIRFIGQMSNIEDIINASDICVLCSDSEGVSNFILESMALGKPVIATNTGGTPEIVINGESGYLIQQKDKIDLKNKIISLLANNLMREKLGANGKQIALSKFSLNEMCKDYYALFTKVIDDNKTKN